MVLAEVDEIAVVRESLTYPDSHENEHACFAGLAIISRLPEQADTLVGEKHGF